MQDSKLQATRQRKALKLTSAETPSNTLPAFRFHLHVYFFQTNPQSVADALRLRDSLVSGVASGSFVAVCSGVTPSVLPGLNASSSVPPVNMGPRGPHPAGSYEVALR